MAKMLVNCTYHSNAKVGKVYKKFKFKIKTICYWPKTIFKCHVIEYYLRYVYNVILPNSIIKRPKEQGQKKSRS